MTHSLKVGHLKKKNSQSLRLNLTLYPGFAEEQRNPTKHPEEVGHSPKCILVGVINQSHRRIYLRRNKHTQEIKSLFAFILRSGYSIFVAIKWWK